MATKRGTFKDSKGIDKPTISLFREEGNKLPFFFGVGKANLIVENYEDIKKFYEDNKDEKDSDRYATKDEVMKAFKKIAREDKGLLDRLAKEED